MAEEIEIYLKEAKNCIRFAQEALEKALPSVAKTGVKNRFAVAIEVQEGGACNPRAIVNALQREIKLIPHGEDVCNDPALRLITHQLAHIMGVLSDYPLWDKDMEACRNANKN